MLQKLKDKINGFSKCAGIEVVLSGDAVYYNVFLLEKKGSLIAVTDKKENVITVEDLKSLIPGDVPTAITINGRGVIHRKLKEEEDDSALLSQILPDARVQDFYIQKYLSGVALFVSIVRKETADTIFNQLSDAGLAIINLSLGPFTVGSLIPFLNPFTEILDLGFFSIGVKNDFSIIDFSANKDPKTGLYKIGAEELNGTSLIAYASALQLFFPKETRIKADSEQIDFRSAEIYAKRKFQFTGKALLVFFFLIALINYLFYSNLREDNAILLESSNRYQQALSEVTILQKKIDEKEYFLKRAGWLSFPKASFYSDEIASTVPSSVKLTSLEVNPLNEKLSKKEKKQIFQSDTIWVEGVCSNPVVLNPWMKELKSKDWVKGLTTSDYSFDHKKRNGSFKLEIWIKNEF